MTPKKITAFRIDEELLEGLEKVWERDGITAAEQVRRAIRAWLEKKGVKVKAAPRRAVTRRRT
jgi:predicted DNA-binding protein